MGSSLSIDGRPVALGHFIVPEMGLSSARATMCKHQFALKVSKGEIMARMAAHYTDWVRESRRDDEMCGGPQDELGEADYPELAELLGDPALTELVFGRYLKAELFGVVAPCEDRPEHWVDSVTSCRITDDAVEFIGVCYSG